MKKPRYKLRLFFLYVFSFMASVLPVGIALALNFSEYTKTVEETVKLGAGGVIIVVLIIIKLLGKLKMPRRITLFALVFILSYLLSSLLDDLMLLSGLALLGEFVDFIFFQHAIKATRENMLIGKTSNATAAQVEEVLKKYVGRA